MQHVSGQSRQHGGSIYATGQTAEYISAHYGLVKEMENFLLDGSNSLGEVKGKIFC